VHKVKIGITKFNDDDNRDGTQWVSKIKKYFAMHQIYDQDDNINITAMYLDKSACVWFLWWYSKSGGGLVREWDTFKKNIF